jgi:hypothetical protein
MGGFSPNIRDYPEAFPVFRTFPIFRSEPIFQDDDLDIYTNPELS